MPNPSNLNEHLDELARQVKSLQEMVRPPRPPRWPWALAVLLALGGLFAVLKVLQLDPHAQLEPVVAPIEPSREAAQRLWLP